MPTKTGLLLINLGSPKSPSKRDVRYYLDEFLSDPRVIDLPPLLRFILLHGVILRFRPKKSAKAYQLIWTKQGSPLITHSQHLTDKLQLSLGDAYHVEIAMRYGSPSISSKLKKLADCEKLIVLPLYPQYASSSTGTAIEAVLNEIKGQWNLPSLRVITDFYQDKGYIDAVSASLSPYLAKTPTAHVLFSYHGLPERHINKSGCQTICPSACHDMTKNAWCYRAQCFKTTKLIAQTLGLKQDNHTTAFQSRLGKTPWIKPYTEEVLQELRNQDIKDLVIICPSFTVDCLETLEEIGISAKNRWLSLGGRSFNLVPCLNTNDDWVEALSRLVKGN